MLLNRSRRSDDHVRVCSVGFLVYAAAALSSYSDAKDEFEGCEMSNGSLGICRVFQECQPLVEALQKGEISINDPKSCGYKGKYELVCCPTDQPVVIQTTAPFVFEDTSGAQHVTAATETTTTTTTTTTTAKPDFWLHLLSTTSTTTAKPDFWLHLLSTTTAKPTITTTAKPDFWLHLLSTTTTTTTTPKPLVVGDQELDKNSEFYDFSKLLKPEENTDQTAGMNTGSSSHQIQKPVGQQTSANSEGSANGLISKPFKGFSDDELVNAAAGNVPANSMGNGPGIGFTHTGLGNNVETGPGINIGTGLGNNVGSGFANHLGESGVHNGFINGNARGNAFGNGIRIGRGSNGLGHGRGGNGNGNGFGRGRGNGVGNGFGNNHGNNNGVLNGPGHGFISGPGNGVFNGPTGQGNDFQNGPGNNFQNGPGSGFVNAPGNGFVNAPGNGFVNAPGNGFVNVPGNGFRNNPGNGNGFGHGRGARGGNNGFRSISANDVIHFQGPSFHRPNIWPHQVEVQVPIQQQQPQQTFLITPNGNRVVWSGAEPTVAVLDPNFNNPNIEFIPQNNLGTTTAEVWQPTAIVTSPSGPLWPTPSSPNNGIVQTFVPSDNQLSNFNIIKSEPMINPNKPEFPISQLHQSGFPDQLAADSNHITDESEDKVAGRNPWLWPSTDSSSSRITHTTTTTKKPKPAVRTERPAVAACRAIEENLNPYLTPQILDGTPVASGEYPHMAAIGYSSISEEGGPYDFRCGGALIHERFVLTAAHCVNSRNATPAIVRLGMVDFDDPDQIPNRAEIPIKEIHIHDNYSSRRKYDDIALLELQENVKFSTYIYPACLYTDPGDPPADAQLYVTGWGTVNTTTRKRSNILLKAQLKIEPLDNCNTSYVEFGLTRQLDRGVLDTQICARDPGYTKDACQGDSGGPLNMVVDETTGNFRIVGVISTGFGCASAIPGLYTRVSAYLDFIESKIWPSE